MKLTQYFFPRVFIDLTIAIGKHCEKLRAEKRCPGDCGDCQRSYYWMALNQLRKDAEEEMRQVIKCAVAADRKKLQETARNCKELKP